MNASPPSLPTPRHNCSATIVPPSMASMSCDSGADTCFTTNTFILHVMAHESNPGLYSEQYMPTTYSAIDLAKRARTEVLNQQAHARVSCQLPCDVSLAFVCKYRHVWHEGLFIFHAYLITW